MNGLPLNNELASIRSILRFEDYRKNSVVERHFPNVDYYFLAVRALKTCIREFREKPLVFEFTVGKNLRSIIRVVLNIQKRTKDPIDLQVEDSAEWSRPSSEL